MDKLMIYWAPAASLKGTVHSVIEELAARALRDQGVLAGRHMASLFCRRIRIGILMGPIRGGSPSARFGSGPWASIYSRSAPNRGRRPSPGV